MQKYKTAINPSHGIGLLFAIFVFMLIVVSLISALILNRWGATTPALRIQAIIQDLLMFILPAIVTSLLVTRLPAEFLGLMAKPRAAGSLWAIVAMLAAIPAMNLIIQWNASWTLPASWASMKEMEESAAETIKIMMGQATVPNLVMSILIIGILTGLGEELFFRGALLRLLMGTRMNPHLAIWTTAVIFSAFHMQIYGIIPRMLLGAFFGYALWWSRSLWLPIILHALNNSLVVINTWDINRGTTTFDIDTIGTNQPYSWAIIAASILLTAAALFLTRRLSASRQPKQSAGLAGE